MPTPPIAYMVSEYPATSHTFIQREVLALRARGVTVRTFTIRHTGPQLSEDSRREQRTTTALAPVSARKFFTTHLGALVTAPRAYARTLRFALSRGERRPRRTLWQLFYFAEAVLLWEGCRRQSITHIHAHFANSGADIARLAAVFGRERGDGWTWSFTMHGSAEFLDMKRFGLAAKANDALFVACISDYCRSQLMWLIPSTDWAKLSVVHGGIEERSSSESSAAEHSQSRTLHVLTVGRLIPLKGHSLLIQVARLLVDRGIDVSVRIIGEGPHRDALQEDIRRHQVEDRVQLVGAVGQDEIQAHYDWADVFCLPSMMEGLPVVLMEAMAAGIPVLAPAITGVPEIVDQGVSGILFRPGRADQMADGLLRLTADNALRRRLTQAARTKIREEFDISVTAQSMQKLFCQWLTPAQPDGELLPPL